MLSFPTPILNLIKNMGWAVEKSEQGKSKAILGMFD